MTEYFRDPHALVEPGVLVGKSTKIWRHAHIRSGSTIGAHCVIGENVYVGPEVTIGNCVKIQNGSQLFGPLTVSDGVFVGPNTIFTNDKSPRAITVEHNLKASSDWEAAETQVGYGASLGAGAICVAPVKIGNWAMIGAGAVVAKNVKDFELVVGLPAIRVGWVCRCGNKITRYLREYFCQKCKKNFRYEKEADVMVEL